MYIVTAWGNRDDDGIVAQWASDVLQSGAKRVTPHRPSVRGEEEETSFNGILLITKTPPFVSRRYEMQLCGRRRRN